ncbi:MAG: tRNA ((37)-N6)-threonylcarbamoyltransferase complex transferase subunit TsaD [Pseudomonadota bacterium]
MVSASMVTTRFEALKAWDFGMAQCSGPTLMPMQVLGIESSCDETGVALVAYEATSSDFSESAKPLQSPQIPRLLGHALHSQVAMHRDYGGVVPELASRDHIQRVIPLVRSVLDQSKAKLESIDVVAYTRGPGLAGALLVGASLAQGLALALNRPVLGVHHLEGHLLSPFLSEQRPQFPFVALLVSGGHTQLMAVQSVGHYECLGESIDDAAGEAFDKTAKLMGLDYPGGAAMSRLAQGGDPAAFAFPRPLLHSGDLNFSFAGLKTAVWTQIRKLGESAVDHGPDLAASTQAAIVEVLVRKSMMALDQTGMKRLVVAGGVGANAKLRELLAKACAQYGVDLHFPELSWCTDNGAMIALAAAMRLQAEVASLERPGAFDVKPRWPLTAKE